MYCRGFWRVAGTRSVPRLAAFLQSSSSEALASDLGVLAVAGLRILLNH
jgi:hypothetical protein